MNNKKTIVFIPGGPGLSAQTFDLFLTPHLEKDFDLQFYHPMGTADNSSKETPSYQALLNELTTFVKNIDTDIILFGHSFGGLLATDLICSKKFQKVKGLVVLATPFSQTAFKVINTSYAKNMNDEGRYAIKQFSKYPTNENLKKSMIGCKNIYFNQPSDEILNAMQQDSCNIDIFINARGEAEKKEYLLEQIKSISCKTIFMAGEKDRLFPLESCEEEANKGNFQLAIIPQAGHFAYIDNPEGVADALKTNFLKEKLS